MKWDKKNIAIWVTIILLLVTIGIVAFNIIDKGFPWSRNGLKEWEFVALISGIGVALGILIRLSIWLWRRKTRKECPYCKESIKLHAKVCRYCTKEIP